MVRIICGNYHLHYIMGVVQNNIHYGAYGDCWRNNTVKVFESVMLSFSFSRDKILSYNEVTTNLSKRRIEMRELTKKEKEALKGVASVILAVGSAAVVIAVMVKCNKRISDTAKVVKDVLTPKEPFASIDEDIFTSLAIGLENAVMDEGVDDTTLTRFYALTDEFGKLVTVNVHKMAVE